MKIKKWIAIGLWALITLLLCMTWWFGLQVDLTGDAGLYASIARQMTENREWLNLSINGVPYDQKPHLLFWLAGAGITLFGNLNFAYKLFPFLFSLSSLWFTYKLSYTLWGRKAAWLAILMTATSQIYFLYFMDIHTDTVLQTGVILALWQLTVYHKQRKKSSFILSFVGVGLAMLAKGPIGAVLPFFYMVILLTGEKNYRELLHYRWIVGIVIVLIVISPSLIHLYKNFGLKGIQFYFIDNNFGRITGRVAGSNRDPLFYLYNLLWSLLPWTLLVIYGFIKEIISLKKNRNIYNLALIGSLLLFLIIISIARGKAPNYLLIAIAPIIAVSSGQTVKLISSSNTSGRYLAYIQLFILTLFTLLFIITGFLFQGLEKSMIILLILSALLIIAFGLVEQVRNMRLLFASTLTIITFNLFLNFKLLPEMFAFQGARQALEIFNMHSTSKGRLKSLNLDEYELYYYGSSQVERFSDWEEFYEYLKGEDTWVYTNQIGYNTVKELTTSIDTVYLIRYKRMNEPEPLFFIPSLRDSTLKNNYLIKIR